MTKILRTPEGASGIIQASASGKVYEILGATIEVDDADVPALVGAGYEELEAAPPVETPVETPASASPEAPPVAVTEAPAQETVPEQKSE